MGMRFSNRSDRISPIVEEIVNKTRDRFIVILYRVILYRLRRKNYLSGVALNGNEFEDG